MPTCCHCQSIFDQYSDLGIHLYHFHKNEPYITCVECTWPYHNINSFRKHASKYHPPNLSSVLVTPISNSTMIDNVNLETTNYISTGLETSDNPTDMIIDDKNLEVQNLSSAAIIEHSSNANSQFDENPTSNHQNSASNTLKFLAKLHSYADVPRSRVTEILHDVSDFYDQKIDEIIDCLKKCDLISEKADQILQDKKQPFNRLETEFLQFKKFQKDAYYVPPQQILLGRRSDYRKNKSKKNKIPVQIKCTADFIEIRFILKYFFELPGYSQQIFEFVESLYSDKTVIRNFIQASFWQNRKRTFDDAGGKIVFPIFVYYDDFENNNPLGSHAGLAKCGAVYFSLPFLPDNLRSKVTNIFLFVLFNSLDRKLFKNKIIFHKVITELKYLESVGIMINIEGKEVRIYFQVALILGDNLGLHTLFGYSESFRANHPCRFCLIHYNELSDHFSEDNVILRDEVNYRQHVDNIKSNGSLPSYNVVEECVFHALKNTFHVTKNLSVDVMHDVFEGIAKYDLALILNHYVNNSKLFTLEQLNERISAFSFKEWENRPTEIQTHHLKKMLKMSAAEMMSFIRNFPFLIGDLVPEGDACWNLFLAFKKAVDVIMLSVSDAHTHELMKVVISEYLEELNTLFPRSFKPKHHHLTHYWRVAYLMGPLWHLSSMRYESRHQEGKKVSRSAICRANVCHTIAIKTQLILNDRFLSANQPPSIFTYGPFSEMLFESFSFNFNDFPNSPSGYTDKKSISSPKWVARYGKKIKVGDILLDFQNDSVEPLFFVIKHIVFDPNHGFLIVAQSLDKFTFYDNHYQSYCILPQYASPQPFELKLFYEGDVICSYFTSTFVFGEKEYISVSEF